MNMLMRWLDGRVIFKLAYAIISKPVMYIRRIRMSTMRFIRLLEIRIIIVLIRILYLIWTLVIFIFCYLLRKFQPDQH